MGIEITCQTCGTTSLVELNRIELQSVNVQKVIEANTNYPMSLGEANELNEFLKSKGWS